MLPFFLVINDKKVNYLQEELGGTTTMGVVKCNRTILCHL